MNKKPLIGILESIHQDGINLLKNLAMYIWILEKVKKKYLKM